MSLGLSQFGMSQPQTARGLGDLPAIHAQNKQQYDIQAKPWRNAVQLINDRGLQAAPGFDQNAYAHLIGKMGTQGVNDFFSTADINDIHREMSASNSATRSSGLLGKIGPFLPLAVAGVGALAGAGLGAAAGGAAGGVGGAGIGTGGAFSSPLAAGSSIGQLSGTGLMGTLGGHTAIGGAAGLGTGVTSSNLFSLSNLNNLSKLSNLFSPSQPQQQNAINRTASPVASLQGAPTFNGFTPRSHPSYNLPSNSFNTGFNSVMPNYFNFLRTA